MGLLVPQGLAYGQLAGLPPVAGLYVGLVSLLAYALLEDAVQAHEDSVSAR